MEAPPPSYGSATGYPSYPQNAVYTQGNAAPYPTGAPYPPAAGYPGTAPYPGNAPYPSRPQQPGGFAMPGFPVPGASGGDQPPPMMIPPVRMMGPDSVYNDPNKPDEEDAVGLTSGTDWARRSFSDKAIRRAFIRKVYIILSCQLLITVAFVAFFLLHKPTQRWIQGPGFWFYYVSYAAFLTTYITLLCCQGVRRKSPGNMICLAVFTLAFSYMTGTISSYYDNFSVLIAAGITALVCVSITIFAIQTKIDFTMCTGLLFALCMVLFFFGIATMIVYLTIGFNYILHCVYGAVAALVFSLFLAYDTQMLIGGRKHELSEEEHVFAALQLYLDVVYLFLIILSFFGGKK